MKSWKIMTSNRVESFISLMGKFLITRLLTLHSIGEVLGYIIYTNVENNVFKNFLLKESVLQIGWMWRTRCSKSWQELSYRQKNRLRSGDRTESNQTDLRSSPEWWSGEGKNWHHHLKVAMRPDDVLQLALGSRSCNVLKPNALDTN